MTEPLRARCCYRDDIDRNGPNCSIAIGTAVIATITGYRATMDQIAYSHQRAPVSIVAPRTAHPDEQRRPV